MVTCRPENCIPNIVCVPVQKCRSTRIRSNACKSIAGPYNNSNILLDGSRADTLLLGVVLQHLMKQSSLAHKISASALQVTNRKTVPARVAPIVHTVFCPPFFRLIFKR